MDSYTINDQFVVILTLLLFLTLLHLLLMGCITIMPNYLLLVVNEHWEVLKLYYN